MFDNGSDTALECAKLEAAEDENHSDLSEASQGGAKPASKAAEKAGKRANSKRAQKIRRAINGGDIRYRGPLSYRHLRILAWIFTATVFCNFLITHLSSYAASYYPGDIKNISVVLNYLTHLPIPLFMLASYSIILNVKNGYKRLLLFYGLSALFIAFAFIVFVMRYLVGSLSIVYHNTINPMDFITSFLLRIGKRSYLDFNIFIDLFLCTLLMFFFSYTPKRVLKGKLRFIFRLGALLPIGYEIVSFVLKTLSGIGMIKLPIYVWPFLTTKPPIVFFIFIALSLFIKNREHSLRKKGFTHAEFQAYLKTNRNSLNFSLYAMLLFILASVIDLIFLFIFPIVFAVWISGINASNIVDKLYEAFINLGVGEGVILFVLSPVLLLFSYTRTHKDRSIDLIIPMGGIAFVFAATMEFLFQLLRMIVQN